MQCIEKSAVLWATLHSIIFNCVHHDTDRFAKIPSWPLIALIVKSENVAFSSDIMHDVNPSMAVAVVNFYSA